MGLIEFNKIFNGIQHSLNQLFEVSFVSFSKAGININIDEAIDYINNIIDEINKKIEVEEHDYADYLKLSACFLTLSFIEKFEENIAEEENGN